jgi:hypothetical protein
VIGADEPCKGIGSSVRAVAATGSKSFDLWLFFECVLESLELLELLDLRGRVTSGASSAGAASCPGSTSYPSGTLVAGGDPGFMLVSGAEGPKVP